ncbi:MAG: Ig-like domain-containing protein, partial [Vicinamibacteria bacterium]
MNGDSQGRDKTSAAAVKINGVEVIRESDFSQNVVSFSKTIGSLQAANQLYVQVKSSPGATFTIEICQSGQRDTVPPSVVWLTPVEGEVTRDPSPLFRVRYVDQVSAPSLSTLTILIDGLDRTSLFNRGPDEASLDGLLQLVDGTHTLRAEIKDQAGNLGVGMRTFRVDATIPTLTIQAPPYGAILNETRPQIELAFSDGGFLPSGINGPSLYVAIDDVNVSSSFTRTATEATGLPTSALANGAHTIEATIADAAGNTSTVSSAFVVDTIAPTITPVAPAQGQVIGGGPVTISVQYSDDQGLNLPTFTATIDGAPLALTVAADHASATASGLSDDVHTLVFAIADRAGNTKTSTISFTVDSVLPAITVVAPANGAFVNARTPAIRVSFVDAQGIVTSGLKIRVNGVDRTSAFVVAGSEATATLPELLPEGPNTVEAEIRDSAGNLGEVASIFIIDATAPALAIENPVQTSFLKTATPDVRVVMSDLGSGLDPATVLISIDGTDVTSDFAIDPTNAAGRLSVPLAEGAHVLRVAAADRAGNLTLVQRTFNVDLTLPHLDIAAPQIDGFTNDSTPEIWVRFTDPASPTGAAGAGIDPAATLVFVLSEDPAEPDWDITGLLTIDADNARGEITPGLLDGSHRILSIVRDLAGNETRLTTGFLTDTVAPTIEIDQPQSDTFLSTGEPTIALLYADAASGVDPALVTVTVDGVDRSSSLVHSPLGATLTLSRVLGLDLADGHHQIEARVIDRAGNATDAAPASFGVDTVRPTAAAISPLPQSFLGAVQPALQFTIVDAAPSAGINPTFIQVLLDGVDISASLTPTVSGGSAPDQPVTVSLTGTTPSVLSDGLYILRLTAIDNANNPVELIVPFTVDTHPPVVTPEIPEIGRTIGADGVSGGNALISGTLNDVDPGLVVTCTAGTAAVAGIISGGMYSCSVPLGEGVNLVSVTVTDSTGHSTTSTRDLTLDTTVPVVTIDVPQAGDATAAEFIAVVGHVQDATPVSVIVNGVVATVTPGAPGVLSTFVAQNVAVGAGPALVVTATAKDAAANSSSASVTVAVDRTAPVVTITKPATGAYVKAGLVEVELEVTDRSTTMVEVNGVMAFDPTCTGTAGQSLTCHFVLTIPLIGDGVILARAVDAAGNVGQAQSETILDSTPPNLVVISPAPLLVTNATTLEVSGIVTDASPLTLTVNGQTVAVGPDGAFATTIPAGAEGTREITFVATDAASNQSTQIVSVVIDRTPPALTIASPLQGAVIPASGVSVSGTVADATSVSVSVQGSGATVIGQAFTAALTGLYDGPLTITVRAVDAAGNESTSTRAVEIDLVPPTVTITSPAAGMVTRNGTAVIAYTILDRSPTTILVNDVAAGPDCPGLLPCDRTQSVILEEGDNTFTIAATERVSLASGYGGGRTTTASITITRDSTPPVADLQTPETISRSRAGIASASATDNLAMESLQIRQGTTVICSGVAQGQAGALGSCSGSIPLAETAHAGDSLTITLVATDRAGNVTTTSRTVRVTADGVVMGTVLDDRTSLPVAGATVMLLGPNGRSTVSDENGRYNLPVADILAALHIEKSGFIKVDRVVTVGSGVGTVPLDARLTSVADATTETPIRPSVTPAAVGVPAVPGPVSIDVPAGGSHRITLLSSQGLPNLLPLGFSPLIAFDWVSEGGATTASASFTMPTGVSAVPEATLVRYDPAMRDWRIVATGLLATDGVLISNLSGTGSYALVVPDTGAPTIVIGAIGEPLPALPMVSIPATATSESRVDPAVLPPTGGTATGSMRLDAPTALPSGTIVQADVEETYTLASGEEASAPKRSMDVLVYRSPSLEAAGPSAVIRDTTCAPATPPPDPTVTP